MNVATVFQRRLEEGGDRGLVYVRPDGSEELHTAAELEEGAARLAGAFRELGLRPGDRVVVMLPNSPLVAQVYSAVFRKGLVVVPALFLLSPRELEGMVRDSEPSLLVTSVDFLDRAEEALERSPARVVVAEGSARGRGESLASLLEADPDWEILPREEDDLAMLMYTSGTTGRPKGVMITHGNLLAAAEGGAEFFREVAGGDETVALGVLPLSHSYGVMTSLAGALAGGSTRSVLLRWFDPGLFLSCVERYRVEVTALVPAMMAMLVAFDGGSSHDTSTLRVVISGAAPCPQELARAFAEKFGCEVLEGYGLTETVALVSANRPGRARPGSVGLPLPGVEVGILDEHGGFLPPGEVGEVVVRGGNVMAGYWRMPEETAGALEGGWLRTGDLGYLDSDGYLYVVGRKKDLIIRGGFNIYPREVEEVLLEHPGVAEVAVVGVPDPVYGEQPVAVVVPRGDAPSPEELVSFARARLASYKVPRAVAFTASLPKNSVLKVVKGELRQVAEEALRRRTRGT